MRRTRTAFSWLATVVACISLAALATAQQSANRFTVNFSDGSRPGLVRISLMNGSITVRGSNRKDVAIEARERGDSGPGRGAPGDAPGLRRLTQTGSFSVEEANNVISIDSHSFKSVVDFEVEVPSRTNLNLTSINGGMMQIEDVEGELELHCTNGGISLMRVGGSVVAHAVNGGVKATIARVTPQKPMAFTALNGGVDVTLPASVKANLKLRSDQGDVFTDFDLQLNPAAAPTIDDQRRSGGRYRIDVNKAIIGSINGGGPEFEMRTFNGNVYVRKGN